VTLADRAEAHLGPGISGQAGPLLQLLLQALLGPAEPVADLTSGEDGWAQAFDLDTTATPAWLGAALGVSVVSTDLEGQRNEIRARGSARGKLTALTAAAQATLTGQKRVLVTERVDGDPYRIEVITFAPETPDPEATRRALLLAKPAGLLLSYAAPVGKTYRQMKNEGRTYAQLKATGKTYDTLRKELPDG